VCVSLQRGSGHHLRSAENGASVPLFPTARYSVRRPALLSLARCRAHELLYANPTEALSRAKEPGTNQAAAVHSTGQALRRGDGYLWSFVWVAGNGSGTAGKVS